MACTLIIFIIMIMVTTILSDCENMQITEFQFIRFRKLLLIGLLFQVIGHLSLYSQALSIIVGKISDAKTGEPLVGATVVLNDTTGVASDANGHYQFTLYPGIYTFSIQFVGYNTHLRKVRVDQQDTLWLDIHLEMNIGELEEIVVTAGKFDQKLSDVTVSMEILKPAMIQQNNHVSLETLVNRIPGIDVLDGQTSIRGGSGYSYGAGSRVLVLVDDLPIITADVGDVKWEFLPVENVSQVEILKGASSVLYGSSALNGVINLRTAFPKPDPETKITVFSGIYMDPKREELIWWDKQPLFYGMTINHLRKAGNLDIVAGGNLYHNPGYRENEWDRWGRGNLKLNVSSKRIAGLDYGINSSFMIQDKSDFILWVHADSAYRQNPEAVSELTGIRINADPYITYRPNENSSHSLKTRFFETDNHFPNDPQNENQSYLYFGEYQYQNKLTSGIHWSIGSSASYSKVISNLYGDHNGANIAFFTQLDARFFQRLKWSAGIRWETSELDNERIHSSPVFRTGINLQVGKFSFLRGSIGQGYRFPSVAEKYTATTISSLNIFPNPNLKPEKGWSAEVGIKQGIKFGRWQGFLDLAGFWTEYSDMIEFTFGVYKPDSIPVPTFDHIGFKSLNVGNARINGIEVSLSMQGKMGSLIIDVLAGYTYMNPIDLNKEKADTSTYENYRYLKYRYKHSFKGDIQLKWKKISTGFSVRYSSFMLNIDQVFVDPLFGSIILPGYADYRNNNQDGEWLIDHRISYAPAEKIKISLVTKNMLNGEQIGRPGDIAPPRNITLQVSLNF